MAQRINRADIDRREQIIESRHGGIEQRSHVVEDLEASRRHNLHRLSQMIWLFFGILEGLIGLRVFLKLIAANPENPFARFIYAVTDLFLWPFFGLTVTPAAEGIVLEIPSLIAMLVYALIGWLIVRMVWLIFDHSAERTVTTYERDRF
jgi:hypothetical protein